MIFHLFSIFCICDQNSFLGYWSLSSNLTNITLNEKNNNHFQLSYEILGSNEDLIAIKGVVNIANLTFQLFNPKYFPFYGFYNTLKSEIFMIFSPSKEEPLKITDHLITQFKNFTKINTNYTHKDLNDFFIPEIPQYRNTSFSIYLAEINGTGKSDYYYMNSTAIGTISYLHKNNTEIYYVLGNKFDIMSFKDELRKYAVIYGIIVLFYLLINECDFRLTNSSDYILMSMLSVTMNCAFDFAILMNIIEIGKDLPRAKFSYLVSYGIALFIFINYSIPKLSRIYKARQNDQTNPMYNMYYWYSMTHLSVVYTFLYVQQSFSLIVTNPLPWSLIVCSSWLPQILYSAFYGKRKTIRFSYALLNSIYKLLLLSYFLLNKMSVINAYSPSTFVIITIWTAIQLAVLYLQTKYGCDFFLPSHMKTEKYDYYSKPIPPGSECPICLSEIQSNELAVTTPCGHVFHDECLRRWAEEELICPVCRASIPEIPQNVSV